LGDLLENPPIPAGMSNAECSGAGSRGGGVASIPRAIASRVDAAETRGGLGALGAASMAAPRGGSGGVTGNNSTFSSCRVCAVSAGTEARWIDGGLLTAGSDVGGNFGAVSVGEFSDGRAREGGSAIGSIISGVDGARSPKGVSK